MKCYTILAEMWKTNHRLSGPSGLEEDSPGSIFGELDLKRNDVLELNQSKKNVC